MNLSDGITETLSALRRWGTEVDSGHWQGYETAGHPDLVTNEILNANFVGRIPLIQSELADECQPNLPWAEIEFLERVGGEPHNPHHSLQKWPWWNGQIETPFSHTYSERFWPNEISGYREGIRYRWGDLADVLNLLQEFPHTRQATFPIFFPEDTGATHRGRIPCTLHYHFLLRDDLLHLWYPIRSCDAIRHFRDDVYMAGRLCQWVIGYFLQDEDEETYHWMKVKPGNLYFTAYSFHAHAGDRHLL
jgi:hypothetical protein